MAGITLSNIQKSYDKVQVIKNLNLTVNEGEFMVFVGPSGCAKSTTLRMIAGLEAITGGDVYIGDRLVNNLPPRQRNVSMVFQNYALYPHMTVAENLAFSLKIAKLDDSTIAQRVQEAVDILNIDNLLDRLPAQLSGGQRQRVAMGRAIVRHPDVFLFDEPLSNLDAKLRTKMRSEIKKLHQRLKTTMIYVTHDQVEAMSLADRVVIMRDGAIEQVGTPMEVFLKPRNIFVASFIGSPSMNFVTGTVQGDTLELANGDSLALSADVAGQCMDGQGLVMGVRPENITVKGKGKTVTGTHNITISPHIYEPLGSEGLITFAYDGIDEENTDWVAKIFSTDPIAVNAPMTVTFKIADAHFFDAKTEQRIG